jgi:hypothetical protein
MPTQASVTAFHLSFPYILTVILSMAFILIPVTNSLSDVRGGREEVRENSNKFKKLFV